MASSMPASPAKTPRRAVAGELIHFKDRMNRAAETSIEPGIDADSFFCLPLLEHLEHAVGDEVAADDVGGGRNDGDEAEHARQRGADPSPLIRIAPTTEMAEMALVSDISGVCSSGETLRMSSKPRKAASMKTYSPNS